MELRILGAHSSESRDTRMASYLIDDVLALDAGSLTRALTFDQQHRVRAVFLSHRHFDHTRDLLTLGLYAERVGSTVDVYGLDDTIDFVTNRLLGIVDTPERGPDKPAFRFHEVEHYEEFNVLDYTAIAVPVPHAAPAVGFQVTDGEVKLFYTGDTGVGFSESWDRVAPDALLTEVTFGNENERHALDVGHLTPSLLGRALNEFKDHHGYLPIVIASHIHPQWEETVRRELNEVSRQLGIEILVAEADLSIRL